MRDILIRGTSTLLSRAPCHMLDERKGRLVMLQKMDERSFAMNVKRYAQKVFFIPDALALYFCMIDGATPTKARITIAGALAYFVLPADAIHDFIPVSGLVDDGAVIAFTLTVVQNHVTDEHRRKAREWLTQ